jgi:hypothetical protein
MSFLSRVWRDLTGWPVNEIARYPTAEERAACGVIGRSIAGLPYRVLTFDGPVSPGVHAHLVRLTLLAEGCKRHPAYRAIKRPRTDCARCNDMYAAAKAMKAEES